MYAIALAHAGRIGDAIVAAGEPQPIRKDYFWDIFWSVRGKLGILLDDRTRIDSAYDSLLPYRHLVAGGGTYVMTLGPIAHILGDLAVARGDMVAARSHYRQAMDLARRSGSAYWEQAVRHSLPSEIRSRSGAPD